MVITKSFLDEAWGKVLNGCSITPKGYMRPFDWSDNGTLTGMTHFKRHELYWIDLLGGIAASDWRDSDLNVLITACSIGAEVYDAARIAKSLGLNNVHFYGHDYSLKFTQRGAEGIYPLEALAPIQDRENWFELNAPYAGYASIRKECFGNVSFLEPCDIRDLKGTFDIVSENIMNPCPPDIEDLVVARARHLAIATSTIVGISDEFDQLQKAFSSLIIKSDNLAILPGLNCQDSVLPALFHPRKNPNALAPGSFDLDKL